MRLWALSDLHVGHPANREALAQAPHHPEDWLVLAGDLGETADHLRLVFDTFLPRFARLLWVPGNHELYCVPRTPGEPVGEARYQQLVELCRIYGVSTPEDPYPRWPGEGPPTLLCPLFVGYDYSFGPDGMTVDQMLHWAAEEGIRSSDEVLLRTDPWPDKVSWCHERVRITERRLTDEVPPGHRLVLINHYPLRRELVRIPRVPRYIPWCGTRLTESWHRRFPVDVVVSGHLHVRATDWRDGVRFEEVSLGYPRQWQVEQGLARNLRQILPGPPPPPGGYAPMVVHR